MCSFTRIPLISVLGAYLLVDLFGKLVGFFHDGNYAFEKQQRFDFDELSLTITDVDNGRPLAIAVEPTKRPDEYVWLFWDWPSRSWQQFNLPSPGEEITIGGPFALD